MGYPEIEDLALDSNNGVTRALHYIGEDGTRQDTATRYIHPKIQSGQFTNLYIVVNSQVKRVVFDDNRRASGVEYESTIPNSVLRTIKARKMVILSSGALGTPLLLERSGLGNPEVLKNASINVVADLSGVGENYQDHPLQLYPYLSDLGEHETADALVSGRMDAGRLIQERAPILGWNAMDIAVKIRPTNAEAAALGPNFQAEWDQNYKDQLKPVVLGALVNA